MCLFCVFFVSCVSVFAYDNIDDGTPSDSPNGKMSAIYGYVLNDYINTYGVMSLEYPLGNTAPDGGAPSGVVYADIINFDSSENPYLAIFIADGAYGVGSCHIWSYNEVSEKAKRTAILDFPYGGLTDRRGGVFIGWNGDKRYIIYKEFSGENIYLTRYYTVINGEAFMYVNAPAPVNDTAVIDFNSDSFRSYIDISNYNLSLTGFFNKLKSSSAMSVTYEDIADKISGEEEALLEKTAANASGFDNFDIENYDDIEEYENALSSESGRERFYLITNVYALGEELYYVRFSTDCSYYNYVLLRRTDRTDEKYQILKVRKDCIPLSDRELRQLGEEYSKSTLLYKKARDSIALAPARTAVPKAGGDGSLIRPPKIFDIPKTLDSRTAKPAALIGSAVILGLLTLLWVYVLGTDE